jgi:Protein of unknown function (DUF2939)
MRKTIVSIAILVLVWIGYLAWPLYDLLTLVHAFEKRDVSTVTRRVYFDAVRASLTDQIVAAYVRRTGIQVGPITRTMAISALGIADPIVKKLISPEALSELLTVGWPITVVPDVPAGTIGITRARSGRFGKFLAIRNMVLVDSKWPAPPYCPLNNASFLHLACCSGVGN